jgi:predicted transposase YdaD
VGISLLQLTRVSKRKMAAQAKQLLTRVEQGDASFLGKNDIIEVITTIAVYKFTNLSREEVESMLGITLEETRFYQDVKEEGRVEMLARSVPMLLKAGLTIEEIAEGLGADVDAVRRVAEADA